MYTANTIPPESEKNYKNDIRYLGVAVCSIKYKDSLYLTQEDFYNKFVSWV